MVTKQRPVIIGVTGGSGSGKTTVSREIFKRLAGNSLMILQQDSYYRDQSNLKMADRLKMNYDHPLAFDTPLLIQQLKQLLNYQAIEKPVYDYQKFTRSHRTVVQPPRDVIILEGILVLDDPRLRDLMDIKVFVDTDDDIRLIRRINRDTKERKRTLDEVIHQYLKTVRPMYQEFVEPSKRYADIIVPGGGKNLVAIDILTTKIKSILVQHGNHHVNVNVDTSI